MSYNEKKIRTDQSAQNMPHACRYRGRFYVLIAVPGSLMSGETSFTITYVQ